MGSAAILSIIVALTLVGDYLIKHASLQPGGLTSLAFLVGALLYALPAIGWFYLMRSHSLAVIGVLYSATTIVLLAVIGYLFFGERPAPRELLSVALAIGAVVLAAT